METAPAWARMSRLEFTSARGILGIGGGPIGVWGDRRKRCELCARAGERCGASQSDPRLPATQLFGVDIARDEVIAIREARRAERIEQQLPHVARRNRRQPLDH